MVEALLAFLKLEGKKFLRKKHKRSKRTWCFTCIRVESSGFFFFFLFFYYFLFLFLNIFGHQFCRGAPAQENCLEALCKPSCKQNQCEALAPAHTFSKDLLTKENYGTMSLLRQGRLFCWYGLDRTFCWSINFDRLLKIEKQPGTGDEKSWHVRCWQAWKRDQQKAVLADTKHQ